MRGCLRNPTLLLAVAVVVSLATVAATTSEGYNRRMTSEERQKTFDRMQEKLKKLQNMPFCEPVSSRDTDDPPFPVLPTSFITQVEISFEDNNTVISAEEMYDGDKERGVLKYSLVEGIFLTRPHVFEEEIHYSIPTDESLFIFGNNACEDEGAENCHPLKLCFGGDIDDLSEEMKNLFGYSDIDPSQGFMGAGGILQWGPKYGYKYKSREGCRGMECDIYDTCIKLDDTDNRLFIVYYWSQPEWTLNTKKEQVPVAVELMSSGTISPVTVKPFFLRYDFYNFLREAAPDVTALEPPKDTYCYGMKDGEEPPKTRHYFSYRSETVTGFDIVVPDGDNQTKNIQFTTAVNQEEFYDWDQKIATSKFIPWFLFTDEDRYEHETYRVQDFNQGLHYNIKIHLDTCTIRPIENITSFGDVIVNEDGSIEMLPPWIYDDMDEPMKYTGQHMARGINTDVWIGTKGNPFIPFLNDSYVWYYASPFQLDTITNLEEKAKKYVGTPFSMDRIPVQFEKYLNLFESLPHHIYNIYAYEDEPPMTHVIDVSRCYTDDQMINYIFDLPANSIEKVKHLRDKLMYATQTVLAEFAVVSALRINRLVLEERSDAIRVLFSILDKPDVEGDGHGFEQESTKEGAADKINAALKDHQLVIIVPMLDPLKENAEPEIVYVLPKSDQLTEVSRPSTHQYATVTNRGYSSGAMAGLAIGMLLVGALVAVGLGFIYQSRQGESSSIPRVSMAKKTSDNAGGSVYLGSNLADGTDI